MCVREEVSKEAIEINLHNLQYNEYAPHSAEYLMSVNDRGH